jgi:translation elongation factor P/translation initiation factor 5A
MKNAKIGKFGRDEILVTGTDLFTHEKCQSTFSKLNKVQIPVVKISVLQLISIDNDKFCTLIDILGNTKADLKIPETHKEDKEMSNKISDNFYKGKEVLVTTLYSLGFEKIVDFKVI